MLRRCRAVVFLLASFASMPSVALAQGTGESAWGIGVSFTPTWKSVESLRKIYIEGEGELEGREFTIGIVRGSTQGGDWGVSFVHKPFKDGVSIVDVENSGLSCSGSFCDETTITFTDTMRDVRLTGAEFHWFKPLVTIADRVQIGINLAGGAASVKGTVVETVVFENVTTLDGVEINRFSQTDTFDVPAGEILRDIWALGKVELQAAIIAAPGFKIKVSGGMNMPAAASFRVGAVVLFGGR